ncbi:hypothetical protein ACFP2T_31405 [Plantactinospora solaniradicis]|uniref:Uncharacterized protein n=1 Tax=Plantactinospora solaniradicis TaxID=1723736 RepID=A0ABW1KHT4_9ACTN
MARFDRFNAFRQELAPGTSLPVEFIVLLRLDQPGTITVWTPPSEWTEATLVGRLAGPAVAAYETVLDGLARDRAATAWCTAHQLAPGRYGALVEGWPRDWPEDPDVR